MIEKTLTDPLSTQEIKTIAMQEFKKRMDANSLLVDGLTYSSVQLKFESTFILTGRQTLVWAETKAGESAGGLIESAPVDFEYRTESPNEARQSHDLPIPVMVKTPSGQERRKVKFAKEPK